MIYYMNSQKHDFEYDTKKLHFHFIVIWGHTEFWYFSCV